MGMAPSSEASRESPSTVGGDSCDDDAPPQAPRVTLLDVLALVSMNGYARDVVSCVRICKDARSNVELWERVVDLPHSDAFAMRNADDRLPRRTTLLIHWAQEGDVVRVRETLGRGARVDFRDENLRTALHWASERGHLDVVRELLNSGADVDARSKDGSMALMIAAGSGHTAVVVELVARGANVNARNHRGHTALTIACENGHVAIATELLRLGVGADVNAQTTATRMSALMFAAYGGYVDVVRVVLAAPGVDVHLVDAFGHTALSEARLRRHDAVVAALEAAGAR